VISLPFWITVFFSGEAHRLGGDLLFLAPLALLGDDNCYMGGFFSNDLIRFFRPLGLLLLSNESYLRDPPYGSRSSEVFVVGSIFCVSIEALSSTTITAEASSLFKSSLVISSQGSSNSTVAWVGDRPP
jgi:hypothetical protein